METYRSILEQLAAGTISTEEALSSMQCCTQPMDLCVEVRAGGDREQQVHMRIPFSLLKLAASGVKSAAKEDAAQMMELLEDPVFMQDGVQITVDDEEQHEKVYVTLRTEAQVLGS